MNQGLKRIVLMLMAISVLTACDQKGEPVVIPWDCKKDAPKVIGTLKDREIVQFNMGIIPTAQAFKGRAMLRYSVTSNLHGAHNECTINTRDGVVAISAPTPDKFEVVVHVENFCGKTSAKFNVVITPDE